MVMARVAFTLMALAVGARAQDFACNGKRQNDACVLGGVASTCCTMEGATKYCKKCLPMLTNVAGICSYDPNSAYLGCQERHWSVTYDACKGRLNAACKALEVVRVNGTLIGRNATGMCKNHPHFNVPYCIASTGSPTSSCAGKALGDSCGTPTNAQPSKVCSVSPNMGGFLVCGNYFREFSAATACDGKRHHDHCSFNPIGIVTSNGGAVGGAVQRGICTFSTYTQDDICALPWTVSGAGAARFAAAVVAVVLGFTA